MLSRIQVLILNTLQSMTGIKRMDSDLKSKIGYKIQNKLIDE